MLSFRKAYFLKSEPVAIIGLFIFSDNEKKQDHPGLELMVTMYNINYGSNEEIMEACRTLREYAMYVERIRLYAGQMPLAEAVERAVGECIAEGILSEFLIKNRAEAIKVSIYEYDEEAHMKSERELWYKTGFEEGHALSESLLEQKSRTIIMNMLERGMTDNDIMAIVECSLDLINQVREDNVY